MIITEIDYRIQGYKVDKVKNNLGDISEVLYYKTYFEGTFSDLKVKETRSHVRDQYGIPTQTSVFIEWFGADETEARATKLLEKPLTLDDGILVNMESRTRLINDAKVVALGMLGMAEGQAFLAQVSLEINTYKEGNIQPLIDAINNSTETQQFKDAMTNILNVSYIPQ